MQAAAKKKINPLKSLVEHLH